MDPYNLARAPAILEGSSPGIGSEALYQDILPLIFHIILEAPPQARNFSHYKVLGNLRLVSKSWDALLCSRCDFWEYLYLSQEPQGWDFVLKRNPSGYIRADAFGRHELSKSARSHLGPFYTITKKPQEGSIFLNLLRENMHRIKTLKIPCYSETFSNDDIALLLCMPAPVLQSLSGSQIMCFADPLRDNQARAPLECLLGGQAPQLQSLRLDRCEIGASVHVPAFNGGKLEQLYLSYSHLTAYPAPNLDFLPDLIQLSPQLRSITLSKFALSTLPPKSLLLSKLEKLSLTNCDENLNLFMFGYVQAPNCFHYELYHKRGQLSEQVRNLATQKIADSFLPGTDGVYHSSLITSNGGVLSNRAGTVSGILRSPVSDSLTLDGLTWILETMRDDVRYAVTSIYLTSTFFSPAYLQLIHRSFPRLSELILEIGVFGDQSPPIFDILMIGNILPHLSSIRLKGSLVNDSDILKAMTVLQWRRNNGTDEEVQDQTKNVSGAQGAFHACVIGVSPQLCRVDGEKAHPREVGPEVVQKLEQDGFTLEFDEFLL